jgi:hypothetical protein
MFIYSQPHVDGCENRNGFFKDERFNTFVRRVFKLLNKFAKKGIFSE